MLYSMSGDTQLTQGAFSFIHADGANIGEQEIFFLKGLRPINFLTGLKALDGGNSFMTSNGVTEILYMYLQKES